MAYPGSRFGVMNASGEVARKVCRSEQSQEQCVPAGPGTAVSGDVQQRLGDDHRLVVERGRVVVPLGIQLIDE